MSNIRSSKQKVSASKKSKFQNQIFFAVAFRCVALINRRWNKASRFIFQALCNSLVLVCWHRTLHSCPSLLIRHGNGFNEALKCCLVKHIVTDFCPLILITEHSRSLVRKTGLVVSDPEFFNAPLNFPKNRCPGPPTGIGPPFPSNERERVWSRPTKSPRVRVDDMELRGTERTRRIKFLEAPTPLADAIVFPRVCSAASLVDSRFVQQMRG